jgi:hypothetical protein
MTRVEQLEQQIVQLDPEEFCAASGVADGAGIWPTGIGRLRGTASGKLDRLVKQALADHAAGKSRPL